MSIKSTLTYKDKLALAEKIYNYVKLQENEGRRLTSGAGDFSDINNFHKQIFIDLVDEIGEWLK